MLYCFSLGSPYPELILVKHFDLIPNINKCHYYIVPGLVAVTIGFVVSYWIYFKKSFFFGTNPLRFQSPCLYCAATSAGVNKLC